MSEVVVVETHGGGGLLTVGLVIQTLLALMALWLAWETRRLRLASEAQINLLREENRSSLQPYVFPSLEVFDEGEGKKSISADETKSAEEKSDLLTLLEQDDTIFFCRLRNATTHIARDVEVWVYDERTRNFLESDQGIAVMSGSEKTPLSISPPFLSVDEVQSRIKIRYGAVPPNMIDSIRLGSVSYLLVFYRDIEKRLYSTKRNFSIKDGDVFYLQDD
ncbi:hypothetical protein [Acidiphilium acidophilum]|uniref:hypothetical protein n=1 Tax=Acidiphilium acidophilum TaxID=76588 RepID=UPI002E8E7777|nr:hypothetical protein [Acidiphilium acidophilum]